MPNVMTRTRPAAPFILQSVLLICAFLCEIPLVSSVGVNRSIDDTLGDSVTGDRPTYLPGTSGVWEDNTCAGCALSPATSNAFDGTYTAATYNPNLKNISISFDFTGTAIYIYFILANNPDPGVSASTAANFTLDGNLVSTFTHTPNTSSSAPNFYFNDSALAFSKTGMKNISHQMVISTSGLSSNYYLNFDYALYTFQRPDAASSTSSSSSAGASSTDSSSSQSDSKTVSAGAIAGGIIGGVAAVAIIAAVWFFCRRRKKNSEANQYHHDDPNTILQREIDPFIIPPAPISTLESTQADDSSRPPSSFHTSTALLNRTATGTSEGAPRTSSAVPPLPLDSKSAIRRQRQQELERQMQQISDEIRDLQIEAAERNGRGLPTALSASSGSIRAPSSVTRSKSVKSPDGKEDVSQLKAQIQAMSEHIAYLQDQQNSAWAQGLSDEPPPGYSAGPVNGDAVIHSV